MFNNLKITQKFALGYYVIIILTIVLTGSTLFVSLKVGDGVDRLVTKIDRAHEGASSLGSNFLREVITVEEFSGGYASEIEFKKEKAEADDAIDADIKVLEESSKDNIIPSASVNFLKQQLLEEEKYAENVINIKKKMDAKVQKNPKDKTIEQDAKDLQLVLEGFDTIAEDVSKKIDELNGVISLSKEEAARQINNNIRVNLIVLGVGTMLMIFLSAFIANVVSRSIARAIILIKDGVERIGRGELDTKIEIYSKDETGSIASSLMAMTEKLKEYYRDIEDKNEEYLGKSKELEVRNKYLGDTSKAMLNILEDAKELEEQLKVEKGNIEKKVEERTKSLVEAKDEVSRGWMQIEKEKARLSSSISSLPLGFIMTDKDNNVVVSNPALEKILGFENKKWTLSDITKGISGKIDMIASCMECMKDKKTIEIKDVMFGSKYLRVFMTPIITEKQEVLGVAILVEDITEAKVLERSRDEFFSIASHELRTPLTSIKGNTSMIEDYYGDKLQDKELKEMIDDIHESSVRLINIVNDFLDMSRLEQGRIEFKKEVFDTVPIIEHIVYDVAKMGKEKNIYLKFNEPSGIHPNVFADSARTKQIVYNLLGNSIKFTSQGGVTVSVENDKNVLKIRVADTGQGIPLSSQALLFRKFQQAENNILTRDGTKGTGLGLYISRLMAQGMGGEVLLEKSEENKGSTFIFTLPLATEKEVQQYGILKDEKAENDPDIRPKVKTEQPKSANTSVPEKTEEVSATGKKEEISIPEKNDENKKVQTPPEEAPKSEEKPK